MYLLSILLLFISILIVVYSYLGYGFVLFGLVLIKRALTNSMPNELTDWPEVTFMVAAYNEADYIEDKIKNTLSLDYPKDKFKVIFVTDGSDDATPDIVAKYPEIQLLHQPERRGKIAAVERAMNFVTTPYVIFTDANTDVNKEAVKNMIRHYADEKVGAVAGEKRIKSKASDDAIGAGEGIYWKYESMLKKWDSELYSVVGAAGELFSIKTEAYEPVPADSIIEDFYMTLRITQKGYTVKYEPNAYAIEEPSSSVQEELKRKIRIAAGGIQSIIRLKALLNPFKYGILSFQYVSHRVLRWTVAPLLLPLILLLNIYLALAGFPAFQVLLVLQVLFYAASYVGYLLEKRSIKFKVFFIPYYFAIMNYAVYKGMARYYKGNQSVMWEKAQRRKEAA